MQKGACRIAGAGICCLDHIVVSPQVGWGDTAYVTDYRAQGGGLVATALVACARLGARCELFSLLGDDPMADQIVSELEDEGIGTAGIVRVGGAGSPFS
ncbi:MAG TPA: carbohydrate kinase family protein, partial [Candidatus Hydrogenedentes bacterium]|nr:carbohydrate kinase family protein [Candidatus Hydrogenedentota bacterium]